MNLVVVGFALAGLPLFIVIALLNMISFSEMGWEFKDFFNDIDELADKAHLLPIPLFVFAGFILARSKAPDRLVRLADAALGALPGGLAIVSIVACTFLRHLPVHRVSPSLRWAGFCTPYLFSGNTQSNFHSDYSPLLGRSGSYSSQRSPYSSLPWSTASRQKRVMSPPKDYFSQGFYREYS